MEPRNTMIVHNNALSQCHTVLHPWLVLYNSRVPSPSCYTSSFWLLAGCKNGGRRPGESYHTFHSKADIMDSRCNGLFTFLSTAIEKIDKLQRRSRSYLWKISRFTDLQLKNGCNTSDITPNSVVFLFHEKIASLLCIFTLVTQQPFGAMATSLGMHASYARCSSLLALVPSS